MKIMMQELSSRLPLIHRIGRKIKIWPGEVLRMPRSLSRVASPRCNSLVVSTIAHTFVLWYRRGGSAHTQPEYWFSTDAYITTVDKRHLHFDGLRRVHLTFRMHFTGARACTTRISELPWKTRGGKGGGETEGVLLIFITQCCTPIHIAVCIYLAWCKPFEGIFVMNLPPRLSRV